MARPEGFEPPTLRSEVASYPFLQVSVGSKLGNLRAVCSLLVHAFFGRSGNIGGNINGGYAEAFTLACPLPVNMGSRLYSRLEPCLSKNSEFLRPQRGDIKHVIQSTLLAIPRFRRRRDPSGRLE